MEHWWNGRWGRLARRDVWLHHDAGRWWLEAQSGGQEGGPLWRSQPTTEPEARAELAAMLTRGDAEGVAGWRALHVTDVSGQMR